MPRSHLLSSPLDKIKGLKTVPQKDVEAFEARLLARREARKPEDDKRRQEEAEAAARIRDVRLF